MIVLDPPQIRQLEQRLFDGLGLPPELVMDTAGRAVADAITRRLGLGNGRRAEVVCGVGNNGGDGLVVARVLADRGWRARCWVCGDEQRWSPEARVHRHALAGHGDVEIIALADDFDALARALACAPLAVDALAGIGLEGPLRSPLREAVACASAACCHGAPKPYTVAIDVPSGLNAQTGQAAGPVWPCDLVVTMAAPKPGLLRADGPRLWRDLEVADIGLPPQWCESVARGIWLDAAWARATLPRRSEEGHKYRNGHALVVAGSRGKAGAALLTASACMRAGAGLTTLATDPLVRDAVLARLPDLMVEALPENDPLQPVRAGRYAAFGAGPGLGQGVQQSAVLEALYAAGDVPLLLDADALGWLGGAGQLPQRAVAAVITPHAGEAARLLQWSAESVTADPWRAAVALADRYRTVAVLKGPHTLVVAPDGRWALCTRPNAALAKAGSGDVLAGAIVALLAQGLAPFEAAALGVYLHAEAGQQMRQRWGTRSGLASELAHQLGRAIAALERPLVPSRADR